MGCYGIGVSRLIAACAEGVDQMSYRESDFCCSVTICQSFLSVSISHYPFFLPIFAHCAPASFPSVSDPITKSDFEVVWPRALAPFQVAILPPKKGSKESTLDVVDAALHLTKELSATAASASSSDVVCGI